MSGRLDPASETLCAACLRQHFGGETCLNCEASFVAVFIGTSEDLERLHPVLAAMDFEEASDYGRARLLGVIATRLEEKATTA